MQHVQFSIPDNLRSPWFKRRYAGPAWAPLGLYMIADQLATKLVPAVRERMLRIRFLTAITVGALVTEDLEPNERYPDLPPFLVWEWLVVEAMVRSFPGDKDLWGLPGSSWQRRRCRNTAMSRVLRGGVPGAISGDRLATRPRGPTGWCSRRIIGRNCESITGGTKTIPGIVFGGTSVPPSRFPVLWTMAAWCRTS